MSKIFSEKYNKPLPHYLAFIKIHRPGGYFRVINARSVIVIYTTTPIDVIGYMAISIIM